MVSFQRKTIETLPSLGQQLQARREELGIRLAEASRTCGVQQRYLAALESGAYAELPGLVYGKSFLRAYATFLGLPVQEMQRRFLSEQTIYGKTSVVAADDERRPVAKVSSTHLLSTPKLIRTAIFSLTGLLILVYLGVKVQHIVTPPKLVVTFPPTDMVSQSLVIEIAGQTEREVSLAVNGQSVVADEQGNFHETIDLQPGVNTIEVRAQKKHSQPAVVERQIVVIEPPEPAVVIPSTNDNS